MRRYSVTCLLIALLSTAWLVGCHKKAEDAKTELEKAAAVIAQEEKTGSPPPPTPALPPIAESSPTPAPAQILPPPGASVQMQEALAAYKTGQLEDAVTRLQRLRATPTLTPQQRMAVQDSVAAVMNEIYEMAAKGDMRAIAAVRQYEEIQSRPHQ